MDYRSAPAGLAPVPPQASMFPERLRDAPREQRVDETFGWLPAFVALAVMTVAASGPPPEAWPVLGIFTLPLVAWEAWRRLRRRSLVVLSTHIGVYRGGKLVVVVPFGHLRPYELRLTNTVRQYVLFGIVAVISTVAEISAIATAPAGIAVTGGGFAIAAVAGFAGAIYTRRLCWWFLAPQGSGPEQLLVTRAAAARIGLRRR